MRMEKTKNKKLDLQKLFLCGKGRNKKVKKQVRRREKKNKQR
jgi:hypothetical protein